MLLLWGVRYLDTRDKHFRDRDLFLDTDTLEPVTKAAVELCYELKDLGSGREMLRYRHLFREASYSNAELEELWARHGVMSSVCIPAYCEDQNGKELTKQQIAVILSGSPNVIALPDGAKQHDIDYLLADKKPLSVDQVSLSDEDLTVLGYFVRDLRQMLASAFLEEGPGTLTNAGGKGMWLETAVTDEEIQSFAIVFRRLYMQKEPGNFLKAARVFVSAVGTHPLGEWVSGAAKEYEEHLQRKPNVWPRGGASECSFTRKRLIDVFLYTQYAHQPNPQRDRQYRHCLAEVGGSGPLLTWLFLTELLACSRHMANAGRIIESFWEQYCTWHGRPPDILASVSSDNPEIGTLERKEDRRERLLDEKAEELAKGLWVAKDRPPGGPGQFLDQAREHLRKALE